MFLIFFIVHESGNVCGCIFHLRGLLSECGRKRRNSKHVVAVSGQDYYMNFFEAVLIVLIH